MTISIELFLLDNMLMNLMMLRLAAALTGKRLRLPVLLGAAFLGALYALASMTVAPPLGAAMPKLLFGAALALALTDRGRGYLKCLLALYLSAFLIGGMMLALAMLLGGEIAGGALMGTMPLRILLIGAALCMLLPRIARSLIDAYRHRVRHVRLRVELHDRVLIAWALVDSGNELREPVSGLPVVVLRAGLLPEGGERPVPYAAMGAEGCLRALRPKRVSVYLGEWLEINAYVAEAAGQLGMEEAVIGADLIHQERRTHIDQETVDAAWELVPQIASAWPEEPFVHPLGGNAADPVPPGGGVDMDREAHAGR